MVATLQEAPTSEQTDQAALEALLPASRVFTFEQLAALFEGATPDTFRKQFPGAHASGAEICEWQRVALTKLRVKPELLERIRRARATAGSSRPFTPARVAQAAAAPVPVADQGGKPTAAPMSLDNNEPPTLAELFPESRMFYANQVADHVDGIAENELDTVFGHKAFTGFDLSRFAAARAREGKPLSVKASVVARIQQERWECARWKRQADAAVRTKARTLLAEYDRLPTLRQELERREQEKAAVLQKHATAIQKHAAVLGEIAKAQDGVSAAESAIGYAEYTVVEKLRALRRQAPSLFDVGGDVPRLVEPEQQEEP